VSISRVRPELMALVLAVTLVAGGVASAQEAARVLPPIVVGETSIAVQLMQDEFAMSNDELRDWIEQSAEVVAMYYGRFPVRALNILLHGSGGDRVRTGNMYPANPPRINIWLGVAATRQSVRSDWVLVHEMVHTALADVPDRHHWLEEGVAVYVESMARMQAGDLEPQFVWGEFARRMPLGLPQGDQGLDQTDSWGNTYWGGAVFSFLADLRIRRKTNNAMSLRDALRGIVAAGLHAGYWAGIRDLLRAGDAATGTRVLEELYDDMRETAMPVDLRTIWADLGVVKDGRMARFDASAPEAWLREAMSKP
jgi:hypothetical protein